MVGWIEAKDPGLANDIKVFPGAASMHDFKATLDPRSLRASDPSKAHKVNAVVYLHGGPIENGPQIYELNRDAAAATLLAGFDGLLKWRWYAGPSDEEYLDRSFRIAKSLTESTPCFHFSWGRDHERNWNLLASHLKSATANREIR